MLTEKTELIIDMDIKTQVFFSLKWTIITRFSAQSLSWLITLVVIRLLTPADYGLLAIASGIVAVLAFANELGLEAALVQRSNLTPDLPRKIFGFVLWTNFVFFLVLFFVAPLASAFYGQPVLTPIVRVLSITFLLNSFMVVPRAMLSRKMDFRRQGIVNFVSTMGGSLLTLGLAVNGQGVWSLVWGTIFISVIRLIGTLYVANFWCWPQFSFKGMQELVSFGIIFTSVRAIFTLQMQGDALVIGKVLGKEPTGLYSVAKELAWLPMIKMASIINPIAFSGFSRTQTDQGNIAHYVLRASQMIAMIAFPLCLGISSVANEMVIVILGENWLGVIIPLTVLSPIVALQLLGTALGPAVSGTGKPIVDLYQRILTLLFIVLGIFGGISHGIEGASLGVAIGYFFGFCFETFLSCRTLNIRLISYYLALLPSFTAAVAMYLIVATCRFVLEKYQFSTIILLILLSCVGAISYLYALWKIDQASVRQNYTAIKAGLRK